MIEPKNRLGNMLKKLREHQFRSPSENFDLKVLVSSIEHPTVERIYEQVKSDFPTTSLATVYKTVTLLKELNEVLELGFPKGAIGMMATNHILISCHLHQMQKIVDPILAVCRYDL